MITELKGQSSWEGSAASWVNKKGVICGFYEEWLEGGSVMQVPLVWPDAGSDPVELPKLDVPPATAYPDGYGWTQNINDRGQIAGMSGGHAVRWERDGTVTNLHVSMDEFDSSLGMRINARGDVVGRAYLAADNTSHAFYWPRKGPAVRLKEDLAQFLTTRAIAVNDRGTACGWAGLLPAGRPSRAVYWPSRRSEMVVMHDKVLEVMPTAVASASLEVLENGQIAGCAWETDASGPTAHKAWIYDPRRNSIGLLDDGGAQQATVWGKGKSSKWLLGYLDGSYIVNMGYGAVRPALWERTKENRKTVWRLSVLPMPEGCVGFELNSAGPTGVVCGMSTREDGTMRACIATR